MAEPDEVRTIAIQLATDLVANGVAVTETLKDFELLANSLFNYITYGRMEDRG